MPHFAKNILPSLTLSTIVFLSLSSIALASHCGSQTHCYAPGVGDICVANAQACTSITGGEVVTSPSSEPTTPTTPTQPSQPSPTPTPTPVTPTTVEPGTTATEGGGVLVNPLRAGNIPDLLRIVLQGLIQIGTIILVLALVWVGFLFVVAQGNEEKIRDARGALMWTVIGGLVLLGAQGIATLIQATVNAL